MKFDTVLAERKNKVIYKDGDFVAKVFDETFPKSDILNEALNQARVEETNLNIPKIEEITKVDGKWAIISTYIEGKTMAELMAENPDKIDELLNQFVDIQINILNQTAPLLNKLHDKMNRKICETTLDATTRYELHTRLNGMPKHTKVCHGDFNPSNVIITSDGTPYILDWSHATQGNGAADAARTYLLFRLNKQDEIAENTSSYSVKKQILPASMLTSGCLLLPLHSLSRARKKKENSCSHGLMFVIINNFH